MFFGSNSEFVVEGMMPDLQQRDISIKNHPRSKQNR